MLNGGMENGKKIYICMECVTEVVVTYVCSICSICSVRIRQFCISFLSGCLLLLYWEFFLGLFRFTLKKKSFETRFNNWRKNWIYSREYTRYTTSKQFFCKQKKNPIGFIQLLFRKPPAIHSFRLHSFKINVICVSVVFSYLCTVSRFDGLFNDELMLTNVWENKWSKWNNVLNFQLKRYRKLWV